ncbi:MAG: GAF domain-containing protein [Bacteroidota bacterium]|nr:GAF domain-containing protein [Bacteroidota bacterium]
MNYKKSYKKLLHSLEDSKVSGDKIIETINDIKTLFDNTTDFDTALNKTLENLSKLTNAGRAYVFMLRKNNKVIDNTHEYCQQGVMPQIDYLQGLPIELIPWWMEKLHNKELIHIKDVSKLPLEAINEKETLENQQIKSLLSFPIFSNNNKLIAFIGLDNVQEVSEWEEHNIHLLKTISFIIADHLK